MSHRFRTSKYKNAAPKLSKHDAWVREVVVGSYNSYGSLIKASAAFAAFNVNPTGSQLGVVTLDNSLNNSVNDLTIPILNAHSDLVTDLDFSPFEDGLLATCSADSTVKIWSITPTTLNDLSTLSPECVTKSERQKRVETVSFNPTVEFLVSYTSQTAVTLWDILYNKELYHDSIMHEDTIMSMSWCYDGNLLTTCAKDKKARIIDVRANNVVASAKSYDNNRDSRILWLGETPYILTTGFDSMRTRQLQIRDTRNFSTPVKTQSFDSSTGVLIPLYDPDTKMLFVAGRGDTAIYYLEFTESEPYLSEGYRYHGEQTKGVCLLPKRALRVMETEVNRVLQLTSNSVVSIPYHVPRKSYTDFHMDLYPDTRGTNTCGVASLYMEGSDGVVLSINLNPSNRTATGDNNSLVVFKPSIAERKQDRHNKASSFAEHDTKFKKAVPEPRPRKKSSSLSSSEEVLDAIAGSSPPPAAPVPKTRAKNGSIPFLRTPSSFMTRPSTSFSRSTSLSDADSTYHESPSSMPVNAERTNGSSSVNGAKHVADEDEYVNGVKKENGHVTNSKIDSISHSESVTDGTCFSKSNKSHDVNTSDHVTPHTIESLADDEQEQNHSPRMSVADRLKMFQQGGQTSQSVSKAATHDEGSHPRVSLEASMVSHRGVSEKNQPVECENEKPIKSDFLNKTKVEEMASSSVSRILKAKNEPEKGSSAAPIAKPERKITPPASQVSKAKDTAPVAKPPAKRIDTVFGQVSKYRNFKAAPVHKKFHIENLRNVSTTCPGESELIQANSERVAVPLNTPGGKIAIFELSRPGRQPDGVISALVHGTKVMDFMFDPFDPYRLVVGCDDGRICIWKIPHGGLKEQTNQPETTIAAHAEKVYFVRFHPLAKDILASGSYDLTVRIWDLSKLEEVILIQLPPEQIQIFSFCWSPCGSKFATACKDGKLRVYEPRSTTTPLAEGKGPAGVRGGRVCWALDGKYVIVAGFDRSSERQILMYNAHDLTNVATVFLDVSPSILVPFYDEDSSILLLTGRGDSTIFAFDVIDGDPYLRQLSNNRCPGAHQGVAFLKKNACEVQNVEFARALRLTEVAVEPWSFIVPRVKSEFFQDDLFPPTKVLWEPCMSSAEWLAGANEEPRRVSLKPVNMKSVGEITSASSTRVETTTADTSKSRSTGNGFAATHSQSHGQSHIGASTGSAIVDKETRKKQQETLEQAMKEKLPMNMKLEQDSMEGVDETEWVRHP